MSDLVMCIMAFMFGVIFATIISLFIVLKLNKSWADDCIKINLEWGKYCTKMITRIFDDIEQQNSSIKKEGEENGGY